VLLATAEDAGRAVDMFSGYMWQTRVLEVRLDRMVGEGGAVGYEQQQQQMGGGGLGGQQQYAGMVQQMLSASPSVGQLGLGGALSPYAKHNLGLGSLSGPGSPSVGGSSTPTSMSASMSGSGSVSTSGSRPSVPTSVSASLTGGSGIVDDGARRSPMPLSFAYQLHAQGLGQTQDRAGIFRRECEFARFLSPMSVYIAYIRILSRFYPFIPFSFPLRFLFLVVY